MKLTFSISADGHRISAEGTAEIPDMPAAQLEAVLVEFIAIMQQTLCEDMMGLTRDAAYLAH